MVLCSRIYRRSVLIASCMLIALIPVVGVAQTDSDRRLYDNDELFDQLSGAYRTKLERLFGKKQSNVTGKAAVGQHGGGTKSAYWSNFVDGPFSALVNTLVNNAAADATNQDTQSETALVLGSGSNVICGFNDSGSYLGGASHFTGWSQSASGGSSWTDRGVLPTSAAGDAGDPVLARSNLTGTVFLATLGFNAPGDLQMFRSTDNGVTFLAAVSSTPGFVSPSHDKEWIAVDNFPGTGYGNVYQFWRNFGTGGGMTFTRSTNDGVTWIPSGGLLLSTAGTGQGAYVTVGSDHAVYCFWLNGTTISVRKSVNQGVSFGSAITVATLLTTGTNGDLGLAFRTNAFPHAAVNPINGNIYVVYNDNPAGTDRGDVYFKQSTDGGATWGSQVRVNSDAGTNDQWQPTLAVTPDGTALCVTWYDRRNDPGNTLIERWAAIATISGSTVTFGTIFPVSVQFPPVFGVDPVVNTVYMGDYDQMTADNSFFYMVWGDNRDQSIAVPSRKNANVRFAKIPKAGPGPILGYISCSISGGNGNSTVDNNECNDLTITVKNFGSSTAAGVVGTLSASSGPEVDVQGGPQSFANIASGASVSNTVPFKLNTTSAFACGTNINLVLVLSYTGGSDTLQFVIPSGFPGAPVEFSNNGVIAIPDNTPAGINDPVTVSGIVGTLASVTASFYINHTWDADLIIQLIGPDNTTVTLVNSRGADGDNFGSTCSPASSRTAMSDAGSTPIASGTAPFVGSFQPESPLSAFRGKTGAAVNGVWKLHVSDNALVDVGSVNCWTLAVSSTVCTPGPGDCTALPIQLAHFSGTIVNSSSVQLDWMTISELNNYGFEVQKSTELHGTFQTIPGSFIAGHGTTNEPQYYSFVDVAPQSRTLFYRLKQMDLDGSVHYSDPIQVDVATGVDEGRLPTEFSLSQNFPNPFNPSTEIQYGLPVTSEVKVEVLNTLGQRVAVLVNGKQEAGYHTATFENQTLSSGVYFYTIEAGQFRACKKLLLLR
jgi:subtilisin-like proprotein convertase family protein